MRHHICNFISHVWNLMIFDNWRFARCTSLTPRAAISFQPWRDSAYQKVEPRFEIWSDTRKFSLFLGHAFILVFSVASRKSLEELKPILELIAEVFSRFNPTWKWDVSLSDISQNQSARIKEQRRKINYQGLGINDRWSRINDTGRSERWYKEEDEKGTIYIYPHVLFHSSMNDENRRRVRKQETREKDRFVKGWLVIRDKRVWRY